MTSVTKPSRISILFGFAAGLTLAVQPGRAQQIQPLFPAQSSLAQNTSPILMASSSLPDSPGALAAENRDSISSSTDGGFAAPASAVQPMASHTDKYIAPGQPVPTLTVGNKVLLGIKDAVSPFSAIGWVLSAGYEQATNGSPNYGTNSTAFAQRFGAATARDVSEGIFSDSIMASVLHEDPRYYRMGPGHNLIHRLVYAGTRTIITRTDNGRTTPNFAFLAGNLGGSYLTKTYYPALNQTNTEVFKTFGGSIGGSALGFVASEFISGAFNIFHNSKPASN